MSRAPTNPWRVSFPLDWTAVCICKMYGQDPADFARLAIREYILGIVKKWGNVETYAVAFEIQSCPEWTRIAEECDDFKEFLAKALYLGIDETRGGVRLKDNKIARKRLSELIRGTRRKKDAL